MSDFSDFAKPVNLDPYKRVCYSNGLVLGLEEFLQEELYLLEKHRLHNRALHGYGTICGLRVETDNDGGVRIVVSPGLALDPIGHEIRIPQTQCAQVDDWLLANRELVINALGTPIGSPSSLTLYVVLCYRECKTDEVPVPGGPCRTLEDSVAPSRITDAFELDLRLDPPDQVEEEVIRLFVDLLQLVEIVDSGGITVEEMEGIVRSFQPVGSPFGFDGFPVSSPAGIPVNSDDAEEIMRAAFRIWVTEIKPGLLPDSRNCAGGPPREDCVLLAQVDFAVEQSGDTLRVAGDATDVLIDEDNRPYLLQTRLLQELMIRHSFAGQLTTPEDDGAGDGGTDVVLHGDLLGLSDDDHLQYLLADGTRALGGNLSAAGNTITDLAVASTDGDAVPFQQAIKVGDIPDALTSDLGNVYPDPVVTGLQSNPVSPAAPSLDDVLTWDGNQWSPAAQPSSGGVAQTRLTRVVGLSWLHRDSSLFRIRLDSNSDAFGIIVAFGFERIDDGAAVELRPSSLSADTFQIFVEKEITPDSSGVPSLAMLRLPIRQSEVIRVTNLVIDGATDLIVGADSVASTGPTTAAALILSDENIERIMEGVTRTPRVLIELKSEFILDTNNLAIDGVFLATTLPTASGSAGLSAGIQGRRFESWCQFNPG